MSQIVYIVFNDKFTSGFIDFIEISFPNVNNIFFVADRNKEIRPTVDANVICFTSFNQLFRKNGDFNHLIVSADKIIVSGVFFADKIFAYLNTESKILSKIYFHFWGGDFYSYRNRKNNLKNNLVKVIRNRCFTKCAGLVFLVEGDKANFQEITGIENGNMLVAPIVDSPNKMIDYSKYSSVYNDNKVRILLGNSATETNCHEEALKLLKNHLNGDFEIVCPLSYGKEEYKNKIINLGKELFGAKFKPLVDFIEKEDYMQILVNCDIGIFNNNRQQALGNISAMLKLGKTVYIRKNTSMWEHYKNLGYTLKSIEDIENDGIYSLPKSILEENKKKSNDQKQLEDAILCWKKVIE